MQLTVLEKILWKMLPHWQKVIFLKSEKICHYSIVVKLLCISKQCQLDIHNTIGFLTTWVSQPDEDDSKKLKWVLQYFRGNIDDELVLGCFNNGKMKSFIDAAFTVHHDMWSHTGGGISWGIGILLSMCQKKGSTPKVLQQQKLLV